MEPVLRILCAELCSRMTDTLSISADDPLCRAEEESVLLRLIWILVVGQEYLPMMAGEKLLGDRQTGINKARLRAVELAPAYFLLILRST
jgi:hypothetical protein